jgi:hypothetical protein
LHTGFADQLFSFISCIAIPAGQRHTGLLLEVFDNTDLPGEFGLDNTSFPFAQCTGIKPFKTFYVVAVEIAYQLFLGEVIVFSALFEVFVEVQIDGLVCLLLVVYPSCG